MKNQMPQRHENEDEKMPAEALKAAIQNGLRSQVMGRELYYFLETDSTNIQARNLGEAGASHGTLVVADRQSAGRGRRGRGWVSQGGEDIFMSLLLRPKIQPVNASMLTLVMGLSVARACQELLKEMGCKESVGIKWPNDLVLNGRKVCGILTEMSAGMEAIDFVVIGVGINVNRTDFPSDLQETAASLCMAAGTWLDRAELIARVMAHFERDYQRFLQTEDLSGLAEEYKQFLVNCDREVRVLDPGNEYTGIARGINDRGELLVEREGRLCQVYAGEVSVRGIYGYV